MPKTHSQLPILTLKAGLGYYHPYELPEVIHIDDPALNALVDFKYIKAEIIGTEDPIDVALISVKKCPYHALLVVNHEHRVLGLVSTEDLLGEKPLQVIQERRLPRADISVGLIMTPQSSLIAIDIEELRHAKVANVIATLHAYKQHFALVVKVDEKTGTHVIRGLFSITQMSKQLGRDVSGDVSEALSIAEMHHDLHLHD